MSDKHKPFEHEDDDPFGLNKKPDSHGHDFSDPDVSNWVKGNIDNDAIPPPFRRPGESRKDSTERWMREKNGETPETIAKTDEDVIEDTSGLDVEPLPWNLGKVIYSTPRWGDHKDTHDASYIPQAWDVHNYDNAPEQASRAEYKHLSHTLTGVEKQISHAVNMTEATLRNPKSQATFRLEDVLHQIDPVLENLVASDGEDFEALCRIPYGLAFVNSFRQSVLKLSDRSGPVSDIELVSLRFHLEQLLEFVRLVKRIAGNGKPVSPERAAEILKESEERHAINDGNGMKDISSFEARLVDDGFAIGIRSAEQLVEMLDTWSYALQHDSSNWYRTSQGEFDREKFERLAGNVFSFVHGENGTGARELRMLVQRFAQDPVTFNVTSHTALPHSGVLYGGSSEGAAHTYWGAYVKLLDTIQRGAKIDESAVPQLDALKEATQGMLDLLRSYAERMPVVERMKAKMAAQNTISAKVGRAASAMWKMLPFSGSSPAASQGYTLYEPPVEKN